MCQMFNALPLYAHGQVNIEIKLMFCLPAQTADSMSFKQVICEMDNYMLQLMSTRPWKTQLMIIVSNELIFCV